MAETLFLGGVDPWGRVGAVADLPARVEPGMAECPRIARLRR
jgi:hypothetical protein